MWNIDEEYESVLRTLVSWAIATGCIISLVFAIGKLLPGSPVTGLGFLCLYIRLCFSLARLKFILFQLRRAGEIFQSDVQVCLGLHSPRSPLANIIQEKFYSTRERTVQLYTS